LFLSLSDNSDFNPRARKERDGIILIKVGSYIMISIHAPVKSATFNFSSSNNLKSLISIHAPVKSATSTIEFDDMAAYIDFNPRARKERDYNNTILVLLLKNFNPRARKERDRDFLGVIGKQVRFQSTRP